MYQLSFQVDLDCAACIRQYVKPARTREFPRDTDPLGPARINTSPTFVCHLQILHSERYPGVRCTFSSENRFHKIGPGLGESPLERMGEFTVRLHAARRHTEPLRQGHPVQDRVREIRE